MERFDAIVVGAGAAGCVVARRLVDAGRRVLLVEAGPARVSDSIVSLDAIAALSEPAWIWPSVQALADGNRSVAYRQGRGLGGSTAINTLVATPGDRSDYQRWQEKLDCPGWDWPSMEPWFELAAEQVGPELVVSRGPLAKALAPLAAAFGHQAGMASADLDATGYLDASLFSGSDGRRSAFDAYLGARYAPLSAESEGAQNRNLRVVVDRMVQRVLIEHGRTVGIEFAGGACVLADLVVLSAGALQSPRLLYRSGVAGADDKGPVEDHPSFTFTLSLRSGAGRNPEVAAPPISALLRWSSSDQEGGLVDESEPVNDLMALVMDHVAIGQGGRRFGAVIVALTDVRSRGSLVPTEPGNRFSPGWLAAPSDRRRLVLGVRHLAELLASPEIGSTVDGVYIDDRGTPLADLQVMSDAELERWLLGHPGPVSHVGATLPLGARGPSLVDLEGVVRGCSGLRVVDASVLPHLPNANLQLPVMAVAERLSAAMIAAT